MLTKKYEKGSEIFSCKNCNYFTSRKSQFDRHLLTRKHIILTNVDEKVPKSSTSLYMCECGKSYKHRQSLSLHKKKCEKRCEPCEDINTKSDTSIYSDKSDETFEEEKDDNLKNVVVKLMTENCELKKQIGELIPKVGNNNTVNNINQRFNIQIFLNEQCKDAINMNDFIKSIEVSLHQLDNTKNKGLINGLSSAIIENMNKLSLYERPLHCTDIKRETLYIKDNDSWEKDKSKEKIKKVIKDVSNKQYKALQEWTENNPDIKDDDSKQEFFARTLSVLGKNNDNVNDKIIKNICTNAYIKDTLDND